MKKIIDVNNFFEFGNHEPVQRLAYTKSDISYKLKVIRAMKDLGLDVKIDKIGNICGTLKGNGKSSKNIIMGSHTDSVQDAGQYDGPLGVVSALATIEEIQNKVKNEELELNCDINVVVWACEESSRFGKACLGSKWVEGTLKEEQLARIKSIIGQEVTLEKAIQEYTEGITSADIGEIKQVDKILDLNEIYRAYELHIEQYQVLDEEDKDIGIVSSIVSPLRLKIEATGKDKVLNTAKFIVELNKEAKEAEKEDKYRATVPNFRVKNEKNKDIDFSIDIDIIGMAAHSGTTPMTRRKDPVLACAEFIIRLNEKIKEYSSESEFFEVLLDSIETPNFNMNKVAKQTKVCLDVRNRNNLSRNLIKNVIDQILEEIEQEQKLKTKTTIVEKQELQNDVQSENPTINVDLRMQIPLRPEDMKEEAYNLLKEISEETGVNYFAKITDKAEPVKTSRDLEEQVDEICSNLGIKAKHMPSWAGHDIAHLPLYQKLLIFTRSTGGSHNPAEDATKDSIQKGIKVQTESVIEDNNSILIAYDRMEEIKENREAVNITRELLEEIHMLSKEKGIKIPKILLKTIRESIVRQEKEDIQK